MTRVLALDLSKSSTGYALFIDSQLSNYGNLKNDKPVHQYGSYPWNYLDCIEYSAQLILDKVRELNPEIVVVEETNGSKSRYTQKVLEFLHFRVLMGLRASVRVEYLNTSDWRRQIGVALSSLDKRQNAKLSKAKSKAKRDGVKLDKKKLGIKGRINKKHIAIRYCNGKFGLSLRAKDNDIADAIGIATAYLAGCPIATGQ